MKNLSVTLCSVLSVALIVLWGCCSAGAVTLEWDANTDDTVKYRVYAGTSSGDYTVMQEAVEPPLVMDIADGEWYFVVTAVDGADNESGYSNEVSTIIDTIPPMIPGMLRIVQ